MNKNIYITGFMGAGKSTVGKILSKLLSRGFVDTDEVISKKSGMTIAAYFEKFGETSFRRLEASVLRKISRRNRTVIATGGGIPVSPENRSLMRDSGIIVFLDVQFPECIRRIDRPSSSERPLLKNRDSAEGLFLRRKEAYKDCDLLIEASNKSADEIAMEICSKLQPDETTNVSLGNWEHPLILTWQAPHRLSEFMKPGKIIVLTDRTVSMLHLHRYSPIIGDATVVTLQPGERSKTLRSAKRIYEIMLKENVGRDGLLVAVGGGVLTDLGAFVASTYKRGIPFILVSTSLVGCVDAAIGGKAAVDLNDVKNPVGCFSLPSKVILDLSALGTLTSRGIKEGLVEAYKTGLVANEELAGQIESDTVHLVRGDLLGLARVVHLSAFTKAGIVGRDFKESGLRRILNFGHTYGHAVESFNKYRISHGAAVAMGMMAAISLSRNRGMISQSISGTVFKTLGSLVSGSVQLPPSDRAWEIMLNDKKNRDGRVGFVLLEGVGKPVWVDDVKPGELAGAIREIEVVNNG